MSEQALFRALDFAAMAAFIAEGKTGICYAAPGIRTDVAKALLAFAKREPNLITVHLDFDERVMRMGYGDMDAVELLRQVGINVNSSPGCARASSLSTIEDTSSRRPRSFWKLKITLRQRSTRCGCPQLKFKRRWPE